MNIHIYIFIFNLKKDFSIAGDGFNVQDEGESLARIDLNLLRNMIVNQQSLHSLNGIIV